VELLFVVLIGVLVGLVARVVLPRHELTGVVLLPAIGGVSAAIVWVALTWARLRWDGGWIWVATIAACVLTVLGAAALITRARQRDDEALFERISKGGPPAAQAASSSRTRGTTTVP
jgi:quaternary ammonium compound-resistance protein SugE